jgi:predicted transcriptional regulator of viral defense system
MPTMKDVAMDFLRAQGRMVRARELEAIGVHAKAIQRLVADGAIESPCRGVYRLADYGQTGDDALAIAALRTDGAACLKTAAFRHGLTDQFPEAVWMAVPRDQRHKVAAVGPVPVRLVRWNEDSLCTFDPLQFDWTDAAGVAVRITTPERTVVDLFRYRQHLEEGPEYAEAALGFLMEKGCDEAALEAAAERFGLAEEIAMRLEAHRCAAAWVARG